MTEKDFIRYVKAMQESCPGSDCENCGFSNICDTTTEMNDAWEFNPENFVRAVDEWCKEHPAKTYKNDFFEKFPNAYRCENGTPEPCRNTIYFHGAACASGCGLSCTACWNEEMRNDNT